MKVEKNILIAFILNISFSVLELAGGIFTNSVAIISDSIHDFGDALSIGISLILEKISKKKPDDKYTYGYLRYSILGAFITTIILFIGSIFVIYGAINRIINPVILNYNGMIIFAIFGLVINFLAAFFTKDGDSLNQKAVNLHMLEDVLGWGVIFIGSILMKFTEINLIDSIMSIGVATFILINTFKNLKDIMDLFLEKIPKGISIEQIKKDVLGIKDVVDVHHIHLWSIDGSNNYATMHIVTNSEDIKLVKGEIRKKLNENGIAHVTIEIESQDEKCQDEICEIKTDIKKCKHHH